MHTPVAYAQVRRLLQPGPAVSGQRASDPEAGDILGGILLSKRDTRPGGRIVSAQDGDVVRAERTLEAASVEVQAMRACGHPPDLGHADQHGHDYADQ